MAQNQVLAALQIENSEIRLIIGEFYHDVFYIIDRECVNCRGTNGVRIIDNKKVIEAIRAAIDEASRKLNVPIKNVLLCIPGYRFKKETKQIEALLAQKVVNLEELSQLISKAYRINVGADYEIVNVSCNYYKINGIVYPKAPINEKSEMISCGIDLICGDKLTMYDYVSTVEKAGLNVSYICQDAFCAAKEAAIFEQSINNYMVNICFEASHIVYQLINNGRVVTGYSETFGYDQLIKPLMAKYNLAYSDASMLLFRYGVIGQQSGEERVINKWTIGNKSYQITYKDIQESIYEKANEMIDGFFHQCEEILKFDKVTVLVTGQGAALENLEPVLSEKFGCKVCCYCPDTLGAREQKWTALLGIFCAYRENQLITSTCENAVDMDVYKENLLQRNDSDDEGMITNKLKGLTEKLFAEKES